jgi:hypothetical protein
MSEVIEEATDVLRFPTEREDPTSQLGLLFGHRMVLANAGEREVSPGSHEQNQDPVMLRDRPSPTQTWRERTGLPDGDEGLVAFR